MFTVNQTKDKQTFAEEYTDLHKENIQCYTNFYWIIYWLTQRQLIMLYKLVYWLTHKKLQLVVYNNDQRGQRLWVCQ